MSDCPEEEQSTSVLGRIGSWLWSKSPKNSNENASPSSPATPIGEGSNYRDPDVVRDGEVFYSEEEEENNSVKQSTRTHRIVRPNSREELGGEDTSEEWEEASSTFQSGNFGSDQNVTPHSFVNTDRTGKKLHVYLEETSVTGSTGQEVICTKYSKSLQVRPKVKSSVSLDADKGQKYSSALVGVLLRKSVEEEDLEFLEEMGRKSARRRHRKNSQGESGKEVVTTTDKGKSQKSSPDNPASQSETSPASPPPPEFSSCVVQLESSQHSLACGGGSVVVDEGTTENMDDLYKVERKTETPESKRRSMKISKSEVKLFTKNVPLRAEHSVNMVREKRAEVKGVRREEGIKEEEAATGDLRLKEAKIQDDKTKPGRIADKISLFENRKLGTPRQPPRSADVSPTRKPTGKLKVEYNLSEQRSRSAECLDGKRSSSTSPKRGKVLTIKERVKNFNDACVTDKPALPSQKPNITSMPRKVVASKSLDSLDEPDSNEKAVSKMVLKRGGGDTKATSPSSLPTTTTSTLEKQDNEAKVTEKKTIEASSVEAKEARDSVSISLQEKASSTRTGARSKRRKCREPQSPLSPNSEKKIDTTKPDLASTSSKQKTVDQDGSVASLDGKDNVASSDQIQGSLSDENKQVVTKKERTNLTRKQKVKEDSTTIATTQVTNKATLSEKEQESKTGEPSSLNTENKVAMSSQQQKLTKKQENAVASSQIKNSVSKVEKTQKSTTEKPSQPSPNTENKPASSLVKQEVTASSKNQQQKVPDKENKKAVATPELKSSVLSLDKQIESQKTSPNSESQQASSAATSIESQNLHDKESNASKDTQVKEVVSGSDEAVKERKVEETSLEIENKLEGNKVSRQQDVIDKTDNAPPSIQPTGEALQANNTEQSTQQKQNEKMDNAPTATQTKEIPLSDKVQEARPGIKNELDLSQKQKAFDKVDKASVSTQPRGEISDKTIPNNTNKIDLKQENAATSGQQNRSDTRQDTNTPLSDKALEASTNNGHLIDLKQQIAAKSAQQDDSNKTENAAATTQATSKVPSKKLADNLQQIKIENKLDVKQEVTSGQHKDSEKKDMSPPGLIVLPSEKPQEVLSNATPLPDTKAIKNSGLTLQKATDTPTAQLSVSEHETDTSSASRSETKPVIVNLPQKEQEKAEENSALFTKETDKQAKETIKLASSDQPATTHINSEQEKGLFVTSKLQSGLENEKDADKKADFIKQKVIEKDSNKIEGKKEVGKQNTGQASSGQEASVARRDETKILESKTGQQAVAQSKDFQQESAPEILQNNKLSLREGEGPRVTVEHNAAAVCVRAANEAALTNSTKISGNEIQPKTAAEAEPQAKSVEKSQGDDSDKRGGAIEAASLKKTKVDAKEGVLRHANDASELKSAQNEKESSVLPSGKKQAVEKTSLNSEFETTLSKKTNLKMDEVPGAIQMQSKDEGTRTNEVKATQNDNMGKDSQVVTTVTVSNDISKKRESIKTSLESSGDVFKVDPISGKKSISDLNSSGTSDRESACPGMKGGKIEIYEVVANGDISTLPKVPALKLEGSGAGGATNKQSLTTSLQANKFKIPDSSSTSPATKKRNFAKGRSKDDSCFAQQDAPSSWLDVDIPRKSKLKVPTEAKLTSSGSESNLLDTSRDLEDEDFVKKIKKLCAPFSQPPRKHKPLKAPQPPFAMPAIKEDRFEKTFDPDEFIFGLRKQNKFTFEMPSLRAKLQNPEGKTSIKPARASLADRSLLLSGSRLRDITPTSEEEEVKEEVKDKIKLKSRLEGSCVFSSLTTSSFRSKRAESQAQAECTNSGNVSPSDSPNSPLPSSPIAVLLSQPPLPPPSSPVSASVPHLTSPIPSKKEEMHAPELVVGESSPPLPAFDVKLPDYLEKYVFREEGVKLGQGKPGREQQQDSKEVVPKMPTPPSGAKAEMSAKPESKLPGSVSNHFTGISLNNKKTKHAPAQTKRKTINKIRTAKGFHKRPGKMVLFERAPFEGQVYEIHRDMEDATSLQLSALVSVKVVRGCWVLYEKPGFQGRTIALEEGSLDLTNIWAEPGPDPENPTETPMQIGSIRLAVSDFSIPHIDLFTEPQGRGRVSPYHDDVLETGSFGIPLSTGSIQVHSGVWLVFSDPGYQGMLAVMETGVYPIPETWGFPSPFVGSLRPLKMGGFKVENHNEVKAEVYEKPGFEGPNLEIETDIFSFSEDEDDEDSSNLDSSKLKSVGSLRIYGGLWVGYSEPGFEGQQYILEEGEYLNSSEWGGLEILSIRPIMADFMSPHLKMFSDKNFGKVGLNIDLTVPVINLDETGYGTKTQSLDVLSGVWVAFEEPGFCGESYILEKGLYGSPEDWGSTLPTIASAMPVVLENFKNTAKFKVQIFSEPDFQGSCLALEDSEALLPDGFSVASCKVLAGSWLAFEGQDFSGRMYVLDEGSYPDLRAMGCVTANASILSLQIVGFEFSLPSITLFERCGLKGKRLVLEDGSVNLLMSGGGGRVQSVLVEGGMWVLYEEINYRGPQILLRPGEVTDWRNFSNWKKIGSLRPLLQKQVHFHLRSLQTGLLMTVTGELDDIKLLRVQEMEETNGFEQIWFFQNGHLCCKLLEECCLCPSSSVTIAGARVGLTSALDDQTHLWSISSEGFISYTSSPNLVLEVKGGHNYDKTQVILNTLDSKKVQQQWMVEVL